MEAINKFYLEDGCIESVENFSGKVDKESKIIYEVLRILNGKPLFLKEHIKRMENSFYIINKSFPYSYDKIAEYLARVVEANDNIEGNIKITYSTSTETMKVYYIKHSYPVKDLYINGVKAILYHGERENPNAKIINDNFRELINNEITKTNAYEAILIDNNGYVTEGSKSNIFMIKDNKLITAKGKDVLKGITREKVILLAENNDIKFEEREIHYTELKSMDSMFISGTSPKILPIKQVDDFKLDVNNKILKFLMKEYENLIS